MRVCRVVAFHTKVQHRLLTHSLEPTSPPHRTSSRRAALIDEAVNDYESVRRQLTGSETRFRRVAAIIVVPEPSTGGVSSPKPNEIAQVDQ